MVTVANDIFGYLDNAPRSPNICYLKNHDLELKLNPHSTYVTKYKIECEVCSKLALSCKLFVLYHSKESPHYHD